MLTSQHDNDLTRALHFSLLFSFLQDEQKLVNGRATSDTKDIVEGAVQAALNLAAEVDFASYRSCHRSCPGSEFSSSVGSSPGTQRGFTVSI